MMRKKGIFRAAGAAAVGYTGTGEKRGIGVL